MLVQLHHIANEIILRKSIKWKGEITPTNDNNTHVELFAGLEKQMDVYLSEIMSGKTKAKSVVKCLKNIYSIKQRLDEPAWHEPTNLNTDEYKVFLNDLDFYMLLSGVLLKCNDLFCGYLSQADSLSCVQMLPVIKFNPKRVKLILQSLPESIWLKTILFHRNHSAYINEMVMFEKLVQHIPHNHLFYDLMNQSVTALCKLPVCQLEEQIRLRALKEINSVLNLGDGVKDNWEACRTIIVGSILLGTELEKTSSAYLNSFMNQPEVNKDKIKYELDELELEIQQLSNNENKDNVLVRSCIKSLKFIKHKLNQLNKAKKNSEPIKPLLEWSYSPKEFVKRLQEMISKGYVNIKGCTDVKPIVEYICKFVKVRKQNDSGSMELSSLLSYFKKAKTGDL